MSSRLDQDRETKLQPKRIEFVVSELKKLGLPILEVDKTKVVFEFKGNKIMMFPYSGWASGKGIRPGRGWDHLYKQLVK